MPEERPETRARSKPVDMANEKSRQLSPAEAIAPCCTAARRTQNPVKVLYLGLLASIAGSAESGYETWRVRYLMPGALSQLRASNGGLPSAPRFLYAWRRVCSPAMRFVISAMRSGETVSFRLDSATEALAKFYKLYEQNFLRVRISNDQGKRLSVDDVVRLAALQKSESVMPKRPKR